MLVRAMSVAAVAILPLALALGAGPARAGYVCNTPACLLPIESASGGAMSLRSQSATRFSVGLQMDLFTGEPQLVAAIRHTVTLPHNQVYGGQGDIAMPISLAQPLQWPMLRALGIAGERDVMALLGGGVQLGSFRPVASVAVQVPYATAGTNYLYGSGFAPYAGVNSFARAVAPRVVGGGAAGGGFTCPSRYALTDVASVNDSYGHASAAVTNAAGKTCIIMF